jgi:hypothetical protein
MGKVFSILIEHPQGNLLHHASAGFISGFFKQKNLKLDYIFLGITGRETTKEYLDNVVIGTKAGIVYPIHLDNIFSENRENLQIPFYSRFGEFLRTARTFESSFSVTTLPLQMEMILS